MRSAFTFYKSRQSAFFISFTRFCIRVGHAVGQIGLRFGKDDTPSRFQYLFSGNFEFYSICFANHGCGRKLTVGIKCGNEAACHKVEHTFLHIRQVDRRLPGGNDGMVVGDFRIVEHLLWFIQLGTGKRSCQCFVWFQTCQNAGTFRVNIVTQESSIHTWVGGNFLFVERLDKF